MTESVCGSYYRSTLFESLDAETVFTDLRRHELLFLSACEEPIPGVL
jgi:hypothetical protein